MDCYALAAPTLDILASQTGVLYGGISTILMARSIGYMFGNIVGALAQEIVKKYSENLLSISFLIASIAVFATPAITNLYHLSTVFFFQGISQGWTDLGGTNSMLTMWGGNVAAPLNVVHLGYGLGSVFANLIVKPFLREDGNSTVSSVSSIIPVEIEKSNIQIPYSIVAVLCLLISIGHLLFGICEYRIRRKMARQNRSLNYSLVSTTIANEAQKVETKKVSQYSPRSCGNGYFNYGLTMTIVWILYMFCLSGNHYTFGNFFFTYVKSPEFAISTHGATWFMIAYWLSYSVGRLICAVVIVFVPVHIALSGLWVLGLILAIGWYLFVWIISLTSTSLLVLGISTGLVFSPTFPLSFGFIKQRLNVNPLFIGVVLCSASLGATFYQKLGGKSSSSL
ncbi:unnamed protein product [Adineta ricciae]|uniref:Sodium-dependent glucose transporter 1-like protein n=1 Tax=Adineta ricciae TaxID=249248 RepID=A0A814K2Q9_ADIRI|nr:unnamed protein product [Adineta ricciae]